MSNLQRNSLSFLAMALVAGSTFGQALPEASGNSLQATSESRPLRHSIMHWTPEQHLAHRARRAGMRMHPEATAEEFYALQTASAGDQTSAVADPQSISAANTMGIYLISNINFSSCGGAAGWNQGQCGNCWVFGSTAAVSADYGVASGSPQLFSAQWFDSDYYATGNGTVCDGGDSATFASWYNSHPKFIPWSNTKAGYADSNGPSTPATSASAIAQTPSVAITGISVTQINTQTVSQAQAIANIKSVLNNHQAVVLSYFLPGAGWTDFENAWDSNSETTPWAGVDKYKGTTMDSNGGGHLVAVVGYDNTNNSWVVLNSWGTTSGRPDGYFELPQAMGYGDTMNYQGTMYQYEFDTYNVTGWPSNGVTAPAITTQPASLAVTTGSSATFAVVATGSAPLSYQWYKGSASISGATAASYTTPATTSSDNGTTFHVTVSNSAGSVTSNNATLTVGTATALGITSNPVSQTVTVGASVTFSVAASGGTSPYTYQWYKNGTAVSGATSASYNFTTASTDNSATFYAKVTDGAKATATSGTATLTVTSSPVSQSFTETFDTGSKTAYAAGSVNLASGTWTLNDALIGTSTSDPKDGTKSVRVRNSGTVTMAYDWASGAKTVSVKHAVYGGDAASTWGLWYSTNAGSTWAQAGSTVTTSSSTLATATFTVNVQGAIRFELRKTDGSTRRVNFDDFQVSGY